LIVTQWLSACLGGYLAGRLRTRWIGTHSHEIFFRDTAHGLITWAVATVLVAAAATSVVSGVGGTAAHRASEMPMREMPMRTSEMPMASSPAAAYGIDRLFRSSGAAASSQMPSDPRAEAGRIIFNGMRGGVPDADRTYLTELVATHTGISQEEAQKRVDEFIGNATDAASNLKLAADAARKAAAEASIYTALSLLVGAFIASVSAALGGRLRDEHL
jgi:hypothetical protein